MSTYRGYISDVTKFFAGAGLLEDTLAGATTLHVDEITDFLTAPGQLMIDGVGPFDFTDAVPDVTIPSDDDSNGGTVTLAVATTQDFDEAVRVDIYPEEQQIRCHVLVSGDHEDPIVAVVPNDQALQIELGVRDQDSMEECTFESVNGRYEIRTIEKLPPKIVGEFVTSAEPAEPPEDSPTLVVTGMPTSLVVTASNIAPTSEIEYHVSTVDGFTPDATTLSVTTRSTVYVATKLPDGSPFAVATPYYWVAVAVNDVGSADPGPQAAGALDPAGLEALITATLVAGFILTGSIQIGQITINADDGITIPQSDGTVIRFPADGSPSQFTGSVYARELVATFVRILGAENTIEGTLILGAGTTSPKTEPLVYTDWDTPRTAIFENSFAVYLTGFFSDGSNWLTIRSDYTVSPPAHTVRSAPKSGAGPETDLISIPYNVVYELGGIAKYGTDFYVLLADATRSNAWYVFRYNSSGAKIGERLIAAYNNISYPQITAKSGWGIRVAYTRSPSAGNGLVLWETPADLSSVTAAVVDAGFVANLRGFYYSNNDTDTPAEFFVAWEDNIRPYTFVSGTGFVKDTANQWKTGPGSNVLGISYDGTGATEDGKWHHLDADGSVFHFSGVKTDTARSITYTQYDGNAAGVGTQETTASPAQAYTQIKRSWFRVVGAALQGDGGVDDPDRVRIYVANKRQTDLAAGDLAATYGIPGTGGAAAPIVNGFNASVSAPGRIASTSADGGGALIDLKGDGSFRLGPFAGDASGNGVSGNTPHTVRYRSADLAHTASGGWQAISFDAVDQTDSRITYSAGVMTVAKAGVYTIAPSVFWAGNATGRRGVRILHNGTEIREQLVYASGASSIQTSITVTRRLAAGDTIQIDGRQDSGGNLNYFGGLFFTAVTITRVGF